MHDYHVLRSFPFRSVYYLQGGLLVLFTLLGLGA